MKLALPIRNGRVSPVFDVACRLIVVAFERDGQAERSEFSIKESGGDARAVLLQELGVSALICGAISNQTARNVERRGIKLIPWIVGEIDDVIDAYCAGSLGNDGFIMPGCRRGRGGGRGNRQGNRQGRGFNYRGEKRRDNRRGAGGRSNEE